MKLCTKCKTYKKITDFHWRNRGDGTRHSHCALCRNDENQLLRIRRVKPERILLTRDGILAGKRASWKKYRAKYPERVKANNHRRRAREVLAKGRFSDGDIKRLLVKQNYKCLYCDVDVSGRYHVDHFIPLARGGTNHPWNLQILCPSCNLRKSAKDPLRFIEELYSDIFSKPKASAEQVCREGFLAGIAFD